MHDDETTPLTEDEELTAEPAVSRRRRDRGVLVSILLSALLIFAAWWFLTHLRGPETPDGKTDRSTAESRIKEGKIPNVVGLSRSKAVRVLRGAGFVPATEVSYDAGVTPGTASYQAPAAGAKAALGSVVNVGIASEFAVGDGGAPSLESDYTSRVPHVVGIERDEAVALLEAAGYGATVREVYSQSAPAGEVLSQSPSGGNTAAPGSVVTLLVSRGKASGATVEVPSLVGLAPEQARRAVEAQGLEYRELFQPKSSGIGLIYEQSPDSGMMLGEGGSVFVLIAVKP